MFNFFNQVVSRVTPKRITKAQDLETAWEVVKLYADELSKKPKEAESLAVHFYLFDRLKEIVKILQHEDDQKSSKETNQCFEYFLNQRIVNNLCNIAVVNNAPNVTGAVLRTLVDLLRLKYSWLPQLNSCSALLTVVQTLHDRGIEGPALTRLTEVMLVLAIKFRSDPTLHTFFLLEGDASPRFVLLSSLLTLADRFTADGSNSRRGIIHCLQTYDLDVANYIANSSGLSQKATRMLVNSWNSVQKAKTEAERQSLVTEQLMISLDFADQICKYAHVDIIVQFLACLEQSFFLQVVRPSLISASETQIIASIRLICICLRRISTPSLQGAFARGLVGCDTQEGLQLPEGASVCKGVRFRANMIGNIDSMNDELSSATMFLFLLLLNMNHYDVLHSLFPNELAGNEGSGLDIHDASIRYRSLFSIADCGRVPRPLNPRFYSHYLEDAKKNVIVTAASMEIWNDNNDNSNNSSNNDDSPFLAAILNRLERSLENSIEVNILLTGLISRVAAFPLPMLMSRLLSPQEDKQCLFSVLSRLSEEIDKRAKRVPQFSDKLDAIRLAMKQKKSAGSEHVSTLDDYEGMGLRAFLKAVVVLEEFQAELVAVFQAHAEFKLDVAAYKKEKAMTEDD